MWPRSFPALLRHLAKFVFTLPEDSLLPYRPIRFYLNHTFAFTIQYTSYEPKSLVDDLRC